ncbi:MAG: polyphenol oxidase family protein, partial [Epsilonproteobacteria bacterium]|nr:polyphenol oxidase family protein [Campylobacterota bacterium]
MDILEYKEFPSNIKAFTTLKDIKKELSFSLALHTMQDPIKVDKNRKELLKFFSIPKVLSLRQIHSNKVVDIDNISLNSNLWEDLDIEADGMVTSKKNIALAIFSADCIGALLYDPISNIIGAYHAGWRGSYLNIASNIIELMVKKGAKPKNIKVAISPHIKSCCYEVDSKVASKFKEYKDAIRIVDKNIF